MARIVPAELHGQAKKSAGGDATTASGEQPSADAEERYLHRDGHVIDAQ